jgi:hypothetical protein
MMVWEEKVQMFFALINWDNRPLTPALLPMPLMTVGDFLRLIPWSGDPVQIAAHSLAAATASELSLDPQENLTLSDLSELF